jgi:hypothetical protein
MSKETQGGKRSANSNQAAAGPRLARSQGSRRLIYGLNVTIAIIVALVIAVLINVIVSRGYRRVGPGIKHFVRYDLTATRRYSLSEQSIKVLQDLKGDYQIVGLFRGSNVHLRRIPRLMNEYAAYADSLTVRNIRFDTDAKARQELLQNLKAAFESDLKPIREGLITAVGSPEAQAEGEAATPLLRQVSQQLAAAVKPLRAVAQNPQLNNARLKQQTQQVALALQRLSREDSDSVNAKRIREALTEALPRYSELKSQVQNYLQQLNRLASQAEQAFEQHIDSPNVPGAVQNSLIQANDAMSQARETADKALTQLQNTSVPSRYSDIRSRIMQGESVVILGPDQVKVIPVNELYRQADAQMRQQRGSAETTFLGEEKITGALLSMAMERSPMVVFVSTGQRPALGRQGQYTQVADRLRNANFEVRQWNLGGGRRQRMMRGGGNSQPPTPGEDQKAVWIVVPGGQPQGMMRPGQTGGDKQRVAEHVKSRLKQGDAAMVMVSANAQSRFGTNSPMRSMLKPWGIQPQLDRVVLQMQHRSGGPDQASRQHRVNNWPGELKITQAIGAMQGVFIQPSPIKLSETDGITYDPLVRLTGDRLWAETDMQAISQPANAQFDQAKSADSYTVGVAAKKKQGARLIAVADPAWANDMITTAGLVGGRIMPRMAELTGAAFPANSELFVNSVYWLAGMDELIAASPRTQDVPRVNPDLTQAQLYSYRTFVLAGLPALAIALGVGVWFVRRRG